jgi:predicted MFS family arabinose efflux permease
MFHAVRQAAGRGGRVRLCPRGPPGRIERACGPQGPNRYGPGATGPERLWARGPQGPNEGRRISCGERKGHLPFGIKRLLITGALLGGTVIAEAAATFAIRRFGYRMVLAAGALLLGAPTLALLPREPLAVMLAVSFVRGLGFGLCGVAAGGLTALLLPPERRGEGLGLLGIVSGVPAIIALPAGVWLAGHHQATVVVAVAAIAGLTPLAALRWLPGRRPGSRAGDGPLPGGRGAFRLALIFAVCTVRLPEDRASALWNLAYDAGYGVGPVVFGLLSEHVGYPAGFALTGVVVLAALPAALRERSDQVGPS